MSEENDVRPYHAINIVTGKHMGPFSSEIDSALARSMGTDGWRRGKDMGANEFQAWLDRPEPNGKPYLTQLAEWVWPAVTS